MHVYEVLKRPIVTEKSGILASDVNQYTFEVDARANKIQVKQAVETAFGVTVVAVNMMKMPGKTRRWGRHLAKTPTWKKAVVTLAPGNRIELFEGV
jgi:large subunit ribosomal protein L23